MELENETLQFHSLENLEKLRQSFMNHRLYFDPFTNKSEIMSYYNDTKGEVDSPDSEVF